MQIIMCKFDAKIKSYKDWKTIWIFHKHCLPCTYNSKRCRYVCNCYYYDRAVHISVAVVMRTLLDMKTFSSSYNDQVAAHRVMAYYQKALLCRLQAAEIGVEFATMDVPLIIILTAVSCSRILGCWVVVASFGVILTRLLWVLWLRFCIIHLLLCRDPDIDLWLPLR